MWLKRFFGDQNGVPELSDADVDAIVSWSHRQLIIHDALLPRFCLHVFQDIAAWVAIPPMVALRCLGFEAAPDEKTLDRLEAGIGELSVAYGLGDRAEDDELTEVVGALRQHTKLFIVFWLQSFASFNPKSYFKSQPTLSKMLMALFESPRHGLQDHLSLHDPDDRYDYAESVAQLIKRCYKAFPELQTALAREDAPAGELSRDSVPDTREHDTAVQDSSPKERGIFEAPRVYGQLASMSGDGMWLELYLATASGARDPDRPYPIVTFRADEGDTRKFEVCTPEGTYSVPLSEIEMAIEVAKSDVHSEDYYDKLLEDDST